MDADRIICQPLPLNKPTSIQAQIDEGGNPFGSIPREVELYFENSTIMVPREDQFELKPGEKLGRENKGKIPRRAVKVGSNFSSREGIISMERLKLNILEMLLPEGSDQQSKSAGPHFSKILPEPDTDPANAEEDKAQAKFMAAAEAGRRIYMAIAGHRVPIHRHVENHEREDNEKARETDPVELTQEQQELQDEIDGATLLIDQESSTFTER